MFVLDGDEAVVVAKLDGLQPVQVMLRVGDRGPAHCISTGKSILAYAAPQAFDQVVAGKGLRSRVAVGRCPPGWGKGIREETGH